MSLTNHFQGFSADLAPNAVSLMVEKEINPVLKYDD
jgi:hypothetical protein